MIPVFIALILILAIMLYRMLGPSERTYAYTRTVTIRFLADGNEEIMQADEAGIVFINKNIVTIDGEDYALKGAGKMDDTNARLNFEGAHVKSICIAFPGGEKHFYVDRLPSVAGLPR